RRRLPERGPCRAPGGLPGRCRRAPGVAAARPGRGRLPRRPFSSQGAPISLRRAAAGRASMLPGGSLMRRLLPLCLVLCLGCDSVTETVGRLVLSTDDEKNLGAQMAAEVESKEKVHDDATVQAWLDSVAAKVLAEVPPEDVLFDYQFTV